jgi:TonB family protein
LIIRLFFIAVLFSFFGISQNELQTIEIDKLSEVPVYPGCENIRNKRKCLQENIQRHIVRNFKYPKQAKKNKIQGRVFVQFIVGTGGYIDIIKTRGPDDLLEKEAERIISLLPKFKPGILNGKPVRVPFSMPIIFRLQKNL